MIGSEALPSGGFRSILDGVGEHHEPQLTLRMTSQSLRIIRIACLNLSCDESFVALRRIDKKSAFQRHLGMNLYAL
jgi:hypothetical protein